MTPGSTKSFTITYPDDYAIPELAGGKVDYTVNLKEIKKRVVPALDDELAKDLGEFTSLEELRARVREDLEHEAMHAAERQVRQDVLKQLASRVPFPVPASLVEREIDRRLEDFARRLMEQRIDPRQANIDWNAFREGQRAPAVEAVGSAIVLDEIAKRDQIIGHRRGSGRGITALRGANRPQRGQHPGAAAEGRRARPSGGRVAPRKSRDARPVQGADQEGLIFQQVRPFKTRPFRYCAPGPSAEAGNWSQAKADR